MNRLTRCVAYALAFFLPLVPVAHAAPLLVGSGGTGQSTFVANTVLLGSGTSPIGTTSVATGGKVLAIVGGVPTFVATTTFSSPLIFTSGNVTCTAASGSGAGCLSAADWTTFNNKGAGTVTGVTATWPVVSSGGATPNLTWGGLATTSALSAGAAVLYATGVKTLASVGTSTLTTGTGVTVSSTGYLVGGSNGTVSLTAIAANSVLANGTSASAIPTAVGTSTLYGTGVGGRVLAWNNGAPHWVATSSIENLILTTTGTSGAATLVGTTLNVPQYGGGVAAYPFGLAGNATSTKTQFNGGLTAYASSTLGGGGTQSGVTIFGNATTTGDTYLSGNLSLATNNAKFYGKSTTGAPVTFFYINGSNDIHFFPDLNATDVHALYFGFNAAGVPLTFGGQCCGGTLPGIITFNTQSTINFDINDNRRFSIDNSGHPVFAGNTPSLSAGTFQGLANDEVGLVKTASGASTNLTLTFATAYAVAPVCTGNFATSTNALAASTTLSTVKFTYPSLNNVVFNYHCFTRGS